MTTNNEAFEKWFNSSMRDPTIGITETNIESACESTWQAATAEANKRMAELESEIAELKHDINEYIKISGIQASEITELQADNNRLREAINEAISTYNLPVTARLAEALLATPAESLQAHDDYLEAIKELEFIEERLLPRSAKLDMPRVYGRWFMKFKTKIVKALKEVK